MQSGYATAEGTASFARRFEAIDYHVLGSTGLWCSPAGFGGYRIAAGVDDHEMSLRHALQHGINLIDTSSNYADGNSERLIGQVLESIIKSEEMRRDQVIVVSKGGYLQGGNYLASQERKAAGQGYPDLVEYAEGLEHCIHPDFLDEQLTLSLQRLNLETLDVYLLHNPEYYLGWAAGQGMPVNAAREEFYRRIQKAFAFLETAVADGRIKTYGISSNTFPAPAGHAEFVGLERVWHIAQEVADADTGDHHFGVIQFPMNLLESGAALEQNQSNGQTLLGYARAQGVGCLVNRPLNAFSNSRMFRLAEVEGSKRFTDDDITQAIGHLNRSEKKLWRKLLPDLNLPLPLYNRIKEQASVADQLKHYWRNFGSYERWRQVKDGVFLPRVQGVIQYCRQQGAGVEGLEAWAENHRKLLEAAFKAVGSLYVEEAQKQNRALREQIKTADADWAAAGTLSRMAVRALRSTAGVGCVLVGMRRKAYVEDILNELGRAVAPAERQAGWSALAAERG